MWLLDCYLEEIGEESKKNRRRKGGMVLVEIREGRMRSKSLCKKKISDRFAVPKEVVHLMYTSVPSSQTRRNGIQIFTFQFLRFEERERTFVMCKIQGKGIKRVLYRQKE